MLKIQRLEDTVDPDEMAHYRPSNLNLQCLRIQQYLCLAQQGLKVKFHIESKWTLASCLFCFSDAF